MDLHTRAIIATVAGVIWDERPVSCGRPLYTVYGYHCTPSGDTKIELGQFWSYSEARHCERNAYGYDWSVIESAQASPYPWHPGQYDRDRFILKAIRDNQ